MITNREERKRKTTQQIHADALSDPVEGEVVVVPPKGALNLDAKGLETQQRIPAHRLFFKLHSDDDSNMQWGACGCLLKST